MNKQEIWDEMLIECWDRDLPISICMGQYEAQTGDALEGIPIQNLAHLLRAPFNGRQLRMSVRQFVAAFMPWLSNYLWDFQGCYRKPLLRKLAVSKYTVEFTTGRAQWRAEKLKAKRARMESWQRSTNKDCRHDWHTVKEVRSK